MYMNECINSLIIMLVLCSSGAAGLCPSLKVHYVLYKIQLTGPYFVLPGVTMCIDSVRRLDGRPEAAAPRRIVQVWTIRFW